MQWETATSPVDYEAAIARMEQRVADIHAGTEQELVWLLEHPPLYTAGTSARASDLLAPRFPVFQTGRGGQYTYHGPGQRVAYVMKDLRREARDERREMQGRPASGRRQQPAPHPTLPPQAGVGRRGEVDLRRYVQRLEEWIILTLAEFGVKGELREGRVGVWVVDGEDTGEQGQQKESKIAALGIRVRRGVAYHGIALNVCPDLSHYAGIVPCGIREHGVTSLHALGIRASMDEVDALLKKCFEQVFL